MSCILCETQCPSTFYNFETTATLHTTTPVKFFCEKLIGCKFEVENNGDEIICDYCYNSINELDHMEMRIKQITEDLKRRYKSKEKGKIASSDDNYMNNYLVVNKTDDYEDLDITSNSPEPSKQNCPKLNKKNEIHFSDESDLKKILDVKLNIKQESNDSVESIEDESEQDVSVLYDMMDDKNIEIMVESKKDDPPIKTIHCSKCSNTFKTIQELRSHAVSHTEERPYICEICGKVYRHKTALDIHVGMHNGINPFKCLYCNKSFTQKGALIRHVKIHTGEKPFQCEQCGKCFTHHTSFNIHKISHSGEKSYKCELCGLGLISTSHLKRHMRVHTGEKKYSCFTCGKRFAERYNLVSHEKLHNTGGISSSKKKYKCEICGSAFPKRIELEDHLMKDHSTDANNYMFITLNE